MNKKIKIGIVEDHDMFRQGIIRMLGDCPDMKITFEARNGTELINGLETHKTDILILDMVIPELNTEQVMEQIKNGFPGLKIIILSGYADEELILKFVKLGACSYLPKERNVNSLINAIYAVSKDGFYFEDDVLELLDKKSSSPLGGIKKLNEREKTFLIYFCQKKSTKEIMELTGNSQMTVGFYKHRLLKKTGAENLDGLYEYAVKHKYLKEPAK